MRRLRHTLGATLVAFALAASWAVPASATPVTSNRTQSDEEPYCDYNLDNGQVRCFASFADLTLALSDGHVAVPTPRDLTPTRMKEITAAAKQGSPPIDVITAGTVWKDLNYEGTAWLYHGSHTCTAAPYFVADFPPGWDNQISSFARGDESCKMTLYEFENFNKDHPSGRSYGPTVQASLLNSPMNDRAKSMVFSRA